MNNLDYNLLATDVFSENNFSKDKPLGIYNPMQFVLRLRTDVHRALNQDGYSSKRVQAFSTYLHENIHWWQHIGSNIGFISSISYPVIAHKSFKYLRTLVEKGEKVKPIIAYDLNTYGNGNRHPEINLILNNYYDLQYARAFLWDNKSIHKFSKDNRFFLSLGHCFHILWASSIRAIAASIDPDYEILPDIDNWYHEFRKLEHLKAKGFEIDGPAYISPLGTRAIFEGQARFNQLQYLAPSFSVEYRDFEKEGMLGDIYVEAFNIFLQITGFDRPHSVLDSIVGLFLLVCDVAINPTDGFPVNPVAFETFIISNDPGLRFVTLCHHIKEDKEKWKNAILNYSKQEYFQYSFELSEGIACFPPLYGSEMVCNWAEKSAKIQQLLKEEASWQFTPENMPLRLFLA